jgi:hypothetical protein
MTEPDQVGRRAQIHTLPFVPIAWCRFGLVLGPYILIWWGTWGDFMATMHLKQTGGFYDE